MYIEVKRRRRRRMTDYGWWIWQIWRIGRIGRWWWCWWWWWWWRWWWWWLLRIHLHMYMIYTVAYTTCWSPLSTCHGTIHLGSIQGPWASAVKSTERGLQLLRVTGQRSCTLDFNMVAEQWSLDDTGQGELQYTSATKLQHQGENIQQQTWQQLQQEETSMRCTGTNYHHHTLQESTQHSRNGNTSLWPTWGYRIHNSPGSYR